MALYVINTYRSPSRLFVCGGGEILSREGTTQGDSLAMPWYALNTSIMIQNLRDHCPLVKQVWLADDSAGGGSIVHLYNWYRQLSKEGQKFGYLVNGTKSWLILKSRELAEEAKRVFGEEVNITTEGQCHLGAVIASQEYKDQYCEEKVRAWKEEIERLSEIAKSQPHAAYIAFTKGYKSKFTYFMRTIESFEDYVDPIQEVIEDLLLPTLFGQSEPLPYEVRRLATLATGQGGLGIPDLKSEVPQQFAASRLITTAHVDSITSQSSIMVPGERSTEELKRHQQSLKRASAKEKMDSIDSSLSPGLLRLVNQSRDKGASSWLNAMPLADKGLALNKQEFRDSLRLRYDLPLVDLPSHFICGDKFTVSHALSCKKGGFVAQRHDGVRNLLTTFIDKICNNVEIEPRLQLLDNERFHLRSAVTSSEARLDIKAGGFWARGVTAFFDVRVTHVNSKCYQSKPTSEVFKEQEEEKKRKYQQRVLDVEMGSFTPLVVIEMVFVAHFSGSLLRHPNFKKINKIPEYTSQFRKEWDCIKDYDNLTLSIKLKEYIEEVIKMEKNIVYDYLLSLVNFINKYFVNPTKNNLNFVDWYFIDLIINKDKIIVRGLFYELGLFIEDKILIEGLLELESRINEMNESDGIDSDEIDDLLSSEDSDGIGSDDLDDLLNSEDSDFD